MPSFASQGGTRTPPGGLLGAIPARLGSILAPSWAVLGAQEIPGRHPGGSQEAPRRLPGSPRRPQEAQEIPKWGSVRSREAPGSPRPPKNGAKMGSPTPQNEALQSSIFWGFQGLTRATKTRWSYPRGPLRRERKHKSWSNPPK